MDRVLPAGGTHTEPPCVPKALFDCSDFLGCDRVSPTAAQAAVQWAAFGAVTRYAIGRLLGSAMKTERWEEVSRWGHICGHIGARIVRNEACDACAGCTFRNEKL